MRTNDNGNWKMTNTPQPRLRPMLAMPALLAAAFALYAATAPAALAQDKPAAQKPALTVTTIKPSSGRLPVTLGANGNVTAWQ